MIEASLSGGEPLYPLHPPTQPTAFEKVNIQDQNALGYRLDCQFLF